MRPASSLLASTLAAALAAAAGCSGGGDTDRPFDPDGGTVTDPDGGTDATVDAGVDAPPAQLLTVCADGDADHTTIAAAIAAANPGSTLRVCPGLYQEHLVVDGKPLAIIGTGGSAATVIDGAEAGTPLTVRSTGGSGLSLTGVTLRHGHSTSAGGGLHCKDSTLAMDDVAIDASHAAMFGGGLYAEDCALDVRASKFTSNQTDWTTGPRGGAVMLLRSTGTIADSLFSANRSYEGGAIASVEGDVVLRGNQITGNNGHRGGALYHDSTGRIEDNRIADNVAAWTAGAMFVTGEFGRAPVISGNTVSGNSSMNDGGGIYLHNAAATVVGNEVLDNVSGDDGGGIRVFESAAMIVDNIIERNQAGDGGGGIRVSHVPAQLINNIVRDNLAGGTGGGMDLDNDSSLVRGGTISGNRAGGSGGGIFAWLGPFEGHRFEDIDISNNRAWQGAGIYLVDNFEPVQMKRLRITGNRAGKGGGIMVSSTNFTLTGSLLADNEATQRGGAIFAGANPPWDGWDPAIPGSCPCPPTSPTGMVSFNVLARNLSPRGAGVWTAFPSLSIANSIFYAQQGTAIETVDEAELAEDLPPGTPPPPVPVPQVSYSNIFPSMVAGMMDPTGANGNLAVDPMFVDATANDFHLMPASPCVDAGTPNLVDTDGSRADMGMFGGAP